MSAVVFVEVAHKRNSSFVIDLGLNYASSEQFSKLIVGVVVSFRKLKLVSNDMRLINLDLILGNEVINVSIVLPFARRHIQRVFLEERYLLLAEYIGISSCFLGRVHQFIDPIGVRKVVLEEIQLIVIRHSE